MNLSRIALLGTSVLSLSAIALEPAADIRTTLAEQIDGSKDRFERVVKRIGNRTVEMTACINTDADYAQAKKIFFDVPKYNDWALETINTKPDGGTYFVQFINFSGFSPKPPRADLHMHVSIPLFNRDLLARLAYKTVERKDGFYVDLITIDQEGPELVGTIDGYLFVTKSPTVPNRVLAEIRGHVQLRNSLLYELLPEKVLRTESGHRLEKFLLNYQMEEARQRSGTPAPRSSASAGATE